MPRLRPPVGPGVAPTHAFRRALLLMMPIVVTLFLPGAPLAAAAEGLERQPLTIRSEGGEHRFQVEMARTAAERRQGLMEREHLAEDAGMLFLYSDTQSPLNGFWMYRTLIPLDIAFLDAEGRIRAIRHMEPCGSDNPRDCPVTMPGVAYRAALEVNAGTFEALGVEEGDCVSWPGSAGGCTPHRQ